MTATSPEQAFRRYLDKRDASAFATFYDLTVEDVVAVAVRLARDAVLAEDLVQATYLAALEGCERYDPTLRIVPWTRLTGISVVGTGDDRVRSLAGYIATMCNDVQLFDPATKLFLEKPEPAAQLKDTAKLAAHDERLR